MASLLDALDELWEMRGTRYKPEFRRGSWIQERSHVRTFRAHTLDVLTDPQQVIDEALVWTGGPEPLPKVWAAHPSDPIALMRNHEATQRHDNPQYWLLTCNYDTFPDPINEPAIIEFGSASREWIFEGAEAFVLDDDTESLPTDYPYPNLTAKDLYPITNSAIDVFDPPPTDQEFFRTIIVTRNFKRKETKDCMGLGSSTSTVAGGVTPYYGFDPRVVDAYYSRRVNSVPFTVPGICKPLSANTVFLVEPPSAREEFRNNIAYLSTRWVFHYRERGWELRIADLGYRQNAVSGEPWWLSGQEPKIIYPGISGQPAQNPQKLDGNGDVQPLGLPAIFLRYRVRKLADFNELQLFTTH